MNHPELLERLRARFDHPRFAFFAEVGNAVGFPSSRIDALAMAMWRSLGLEIHGLEIKCSRSDWLRERRQPFKAEEIFSYCDRWWLVVAAPEIVKEGELPPDWGLLVPHAAGLTASVNAGKLTPQPLDREFLASILRKAVAADQKPFQILQRVKSDRDEMERLLSGMQSSLTHFENKLERLRYRVESARRELPDLNPKPEVEADD